MKKYRLIEEILSESRLISVEVFATYNEAANKAIEQMKNFKGCFYRIEEVEESIMDRVKSYEDACKVLGKIPMPFDYNEIEITFECTVKGYHDIVNYPLNAHLAVLLKLEVITEALNEGWKPDWKNGFQEKWCVVYNWEIEELALATAYSAQQAPLRLYFKSRELAKYAAKQFVDLYKQLLTEIF